MISETAVRFRSGDVELGGRLVAVPNAALGCVVCHPHPLYGGDMNSAVVVAVAHALAAAGIATFRFDFRGAGTSGGTHAGGVPEIEDARAAVDTLARATGVSRIAIAGYSFGGFVALRLAAGSGRVCAAAAIAPPIARPEYALPPPDTVPLLLIAGDRDSYCPAEKLAQFAHLDSPNGRGKTVILGGADHFFAGREHEVAASVEEFFSAV